MQIKTMNKTLIVSALVALLSCGTESANVYGVQDDESDSIVSVSIDTGIELVYKFDKDLDKSYQPKISINDNLYEIEGFDYYLADFVISPNKKYIFMTRLNQGYVYLGDGKFQFIDKMSFVIVDVMQHKIIDYIHDTHSAGSWNENSKWVDDSQDQIIFDGNDEN